MNYLETGSFFVALGSTIQAIRWLLVSGRRFRKRGQDATTRVERLQVRREAGQAWPDWTAWTLIAMGSWYVFFGGL